MNKKWIRKLTALLCALLLTGSMVVLMPTDCRADAVTDTISVRIGYIGMDLGDYVEAGTYHWSELASALPIYEQAFSYFQTVNALEYNAIVDSARGFSVSDLLSYAGVDFGSIASLQFYVMDHQGIQAAFDRDSLFAPRYYFNNLPGHRRVLYDENNQVTGYDFGEAWTDVQEVQPMLAIEDNWASFNQEFENIGPNFEALSSGSRFRLLFGQSEPTEMLTNQSAKYVSAVYVTLYGQPVYGEAPVLEGTIGSHQTELTVSVDNMTLRNLLDQYLKINSTNEGVLVITGVTVTPDEIYSDLAHVTINYDIVAEGEASISAGIGGSTENVAVTAPVQGQAPPPSESEPAESTPTESQEEQPSDPDTTKPQDSTAESHEEAAASPSGNNSGGTPGEQPSDTAVPDNTVTGTLPSDAVTPSDTPSAQEIITPEEAVNTQSLNKTFILSEDVGALLMQGKVEIVPADETQTDTQELVIEDNRDEKERENRQLMMMVAASGAALVGTGGLAEVIRFRRSTRRKI